MAIDSDVISLALVAARLTAMAVVLPNVAQLFPLRLRIGLALIIAVIVGPLVDHSTLDPMAGSGWLEAFIEQSFWGALLGGTMRLWVSSFSVAGAWIHQVVGWGSGESASDGDEPAPAIGQLYGWLGGLTFLAMDGPNMAIRALLDSFSAFPISRGSFPHTATVEFVTTALTQSLWLSLRIGSPVLTSLIASSIALAAVQRALPHVSLVRFQLAGNWLVLLVSLSLTVGLNAEHWKRSVTGLMQNLPRAYSARAGTAD